MDIASLVTAFIASVAAAGFGGVQVFVICAGVCLWGAVTGTNTLGFAFSPLLNPASTFIGAAVAAAYANYKGYNGGGNGPGNTLMALQKPDVLLMGGIGGLIGWVCQWALGQIGLGGWDTVAASVFIIPIIFKIIFQKTPVGIVPDEDKAVGGRYSPIGGRGWFAGMRRGIDKALWPAAYGSFIGIGMILLINYCGCDAGLASIIGFGFGGFVLLFPTVPAQHFIGCAVCTAMSFVPAVQNFVAGSDMTNVILIAVAYGFGFGALAANMADFASDTFYRYGYVHIDIPGTSIAITTLIIALLHLAAPALFDGIILPIVIWVLCLAYGLFYDAKWKKFAASKGLTY